MTGHSPATDRAPGSIDGDRCSWIFSRLLFQTWRDPADVPFRGVGRISEAKLRGLEGRRYVVPATCGQVSVTDAFAPQTCPAPGCSDLSVRTSPSAEPEDGPDRYTKLLN